MRRATLGSWGRAVVLAGTLGSAGAAWACSIALWYHVVPESGATNVPLNARVSLLSDESPRIKYALSKVNGDGTTLAVPSTVTQRAGSGTHQNTQLVPAENLAPNTRYRFELTYGDGAPEQVTEFTTGEATDTTAPAPPEVEVGEVMPYVPGEDPKSGGVCYVDTGFAQLTASSPGAVTYEVWRGDTLVGAGLPSAISLAFSCPADDRPVAATVRAVDLAGNASEAVKANYEERCVTESDGPLGCSAGGGASGLLAGVAMVWFALRRRARR